jgi:predicted enzyme related to lactoylglutathione lyase
LCQWLIRIPLVEKVDLNLGSVLVFSEDPERLGGFYEKVLQKKPDMAEGGYFGYMAGKTFLTIGPHDKIKGKNKEPERFLINFETDDVKGEFKRIAELGTEVIAKPYQVEGMEEWIATFADPDGNYFQLMSPWKGEG